MFWTAHDAGGWLGMALGVIVFLGLLITLILALRSMARPAKSKKNTLPSSTITPPPEQRPAERLARDENDKDEYKKRLAALHTHRPDLPNT
ncbi:SHOCT domain-containing protein [Kitasatospora acidiphila]|nr:SHOCT domain-containing protein [Kitasatospora acidiphila]